MWRWGLEFIANCTPARFQQNAEANLRFGAAEPTIASRDPY
jgi:hypothetical protein